MFRAVTRVERGQGIAYHFHVSCGHVVKRLVHPKDKRLQQDESQVWCAECWKQVHPAPDLESNRAQLVLQALEVLKKKHRHEVTTVSVQWHILITGWGLPETGWSDEQSNFLHEESKALTWVEYWLRKLEKQGLVKSSLEVKGWYKIKKWGLPVQPVATQPHLLQEEDHA
ncbi:hypothetical protein [Deinococcus cellulosilyticus]|uniref:Uncharacterized protein n=1 Tax=Deinococcus cellulosilyticus (strain DSM 18568 / NBRC 106333 / KACC 11606 / 5516J-15) TaxID=1223518 RepID=A0A511MXJ6_DEIC1|nr:hypothetical protein [Deinococcus cellulosilyticus]GEM45325.1 hypothetical protein DC3_09600 [Deinococcus cellulosilyticus NBRC 106333 = KACC 11606]